MIYYIHNADAKSAGVRKKIQGQIRAFAACGYTAQERHIYQNLSYFKKILYSLDILYSGNKLISGINIEPGSIVYFRFMLLHYNMFKLLRFLKCKLNCVIIVEMPTYPYRSELQALFTKMQVLPLLQDIIFWKLTRHYIDRIVTYSDDGYINGVPAISIDNGIDLSGIRPKERCGFDKELRVVAVAQIAFWHGYDRFIEGMRIYYETAKSVKVIFNIVGNGPELGKLKSLAAKYKLGEFVVFHGLKFADDLNIVFDSSHIAVESLGGHRKNIFKHSSLKSREYCAKGIPFIESGVVRDIPPDFPYVYYVPQDDSPIIIEDVIDFYVNIMEKYPCYIEQMRDFAEKELTWEKKLQPVVDYIQGL